MSQPLRTIRKKARLARGWSTGLYIAGIAALGAGLLAGGIVAVATGSAGGLTVAAGIALAGLATGGLGLWESHRFNQRAIRLESTISEQRVLTLAARHGGTLQVVDVARELGLSSKDAEALLDRLVDEVRVSMQVTDEGEINYVFVELIETSGPAPRVRVAVDEAKRADETMPATPGAKKRITD